MTTGYAWIWDSCYAGHAAASVEALGLLDDMVGFVTARVLEDGPGLRPAYLVGGGPVPDEYRLDLPGYPGGRDIVGNHVNRQFQLDTFGEVLVLLAAAAAAGRLEADGWRAARVMVAATEARWQEPDAGVWELEARNWTHSRLICAAGLRRIAEQASAAGWASEALALADAIVATTAHDATHPSGRWQRSPDDPAVDAASAVDCVSFRRPRTTLATWPPSERSSPNSSKMGTSFGSGWITRPWVRLKARSCCATTG